MTDEDRKAMEQALEALESCDFNDKELGTQFFDDVAVTAAISVLRARLAQEERQDKALAVVLEQANDEGLWFIASTASEAYLQQALRRLHAAVEAAPARAELSEEEILEIADPFGQFQYRDAQGDVRIAFARAIEQKVHGQ